MRIIRLQAENIKKLVAIDITPTGDVVEITGKNGAGKTSTLDSIWWALGGTSNVQASPIRAGEEVATIQLDLGELKIRRRFNAQEDGGFTTSLVVENADGARYDKPQNMLDAIVGSLTFDPRDFIEYAAKDQVRTIQSFVTGVDFAAMAQADAKDVERRRDINRDAKERRTRAEAITLPEVIPEPVDEDAILRDMGEASERNASIDRLQRERDSFQASIGAKRDEAVAAYERADALRREADELERGAERLTTEAAEMDEEFKGLPALLTRLDTQALSQQLQQAREANAIVNRSKERGALECEAAALEDESDLLTTALSQRQAEREKAIADAQMPIPGLAFNGEMITLNGLPFNQASDAEQLRTSIAIAAKLNPKLRIARVRDGSKLGSEAMEMLAKFAAEHDLQVWIETVEQDRPTAIVIEDGRVAGAAQKHAAE